MNQSPDRSSTTRVGRNEPCPCNSGKKYKKCCALLPKDAVTVTWDDDYDELEELTNRVNDLIHARRLDEAEQGCHELKRRWPDMIDWRDRLAELHEARGEARLAAEHYRLAADFAATHEGFDQEAIDFYRAEADRLDALARRDER